MRGFFQVIEAEADEPVPSLWPLDRSLPDGWRSTGDEGTADECIDALVDRLCEVAPFAYRDGVFAVLRDRDGTLAVWPDEFVDAAPFGWQPTGVRGGIEECLEHVIDHGTQRSSWSHGQPPAPVPSTRPATDAERMAAAAREQAEQAAMARAQALAAEAAQREAERLAAELARRAEAEAHQRCRVVRGTTAWYVRVVPVEADMGDGSQDAGMEGTRAECDAFVQAWNEFIQPMAWRCADLREQHEPALRACAARRLDDAVRAGLASLGDRVLDRIQRAEVVSASLRIEPPPRPELDVAPADLMATEAARKAAAEATELLRRARPLSVMAPSADSSEGVDTWPQADVLLGSIKIMAGDTAAPGWVPCSGQELEAASFPALAMLLRNTYGGNGATTFALPDLRGRVPVQADPRGSGGQPVLGERRGNAMVPQGADLEHRVRTTAGLALAFFIAVQGAYPVRP